MMFACIEAAAAIYLVFFPAFITTGNAISRLAFKAVPSVFALALAIDALSRLGFI